MSANENATPVQPETEEETRVSKAKTFLQRKKKAIFTLGAGVATGALAVLVLKRNRDEDYEDDETEEDDEE